MVNRKDGVDLEFGTSGLTHRVVFLWRRASTAVNHREVGVPWGGGVVGGAVSSVSGGGLVVQVLRAECPTSHNHSILPPRRNSPANACQSCQASGHNEGRMLPLQAGEPTPVTNQFS